MSSTREKLREHYKENIRDFFKDCLRITHRNPNVRELVALELNPAQESLLRLKEQIEQFNLEVTSYMHKQDRSIEVTHLPVRIDILKPRKEGISTLIEALCYHYCEFNPHSKALIMAHRDDGAQNIATISTRFTTFFPDTTPVFKNKMKSNLATKVQWHDEWDSGMFICTCRNESVARGHTFRIVHLSEVAHFVNGDAIAAADEACGDYPYFYKESTANGLDPYFHGSWQKAMYFEDVKAYWDQNKSLPPNWNGEFRFFWGWWQDPDYRSPMTQEEAARMKDDLDSEEKDLMDAYGLDLEQIKWRRRKIAGSCSNQKKMEPVDFFRQEYPANPDEAFVASGNQVFNQGNLARIEARSKDQKVKWHGKALFLKEGEIILQENNTNRWQHSPLVIFEEPKAFHEYVIGGDAAEGLEHGDWSVAAVFDRTDGNQLVEVARYRGKCPARQLGDVIALLAARYNMAFIMQEANAPGNATCQRLIELSVPNMYHRKDEERVGQNLDGESFSPGFKTFKNTKRLIIENAQAILRDRMIELRHPDAIREWKIFTNENGTLTAPPGETDDCVIADALAVYGHRVTAPGILRPPPDEQENKDPKKEEAISVQKLVDRKIKRSQRRYREERRWKQRQRVLTSGKLM